MIGSFDDTSTHYKHNSDPLTTDGHRISYEDIYVLDTQSV